jgi:hypothetical protein
VSYIFDDPLIRQCFVYYTYFIFCLIEVSYFLASFTSPGQTDIDKHIAFSSNDKQIINVDATKYTHCDICKKMKFVRSSHCKTCKMCILRRDHHCVWIARCVGLNNTQYFINFCLSTGFGLFTYSLSYVKFIWNYHEIVTRNKEVEMNNLMFYYTIFMSVLYLLITIPIFSLGVQQITHAYDDITFLEARKDSEIEKNYCCWSSDNSERKYNTYNKGYLIHWRYVIGPTIFHLIFPIPKPKIYDVVENSPLFKQTKQSHGFDTAKHLRAISFPGIEESLKQQLEAVDPTNFIELSKKYYFDKTIF